MRAVGANAVVKPKEREKTTKSGIIIPDTATKPSHEWGETMNEIKTEDDIIPKGSYVLYHQSKCFENEGEKIIGVNRILYWE